MDDDRKRRACPIGCALERVGDAWSFLILRDASAGLTRFDQFRRNLGIAPNILARRLALLVEEGLFEKVRYSDHPPRDEYRLTARGRDLLPVLVLLSDWGGRHFGGATTTRLVDAESGLPIDPVVVDRNTSARMGERRWQRE